MLYQIQTDKFQGPISVLYQMIEDRKLSVSEFSLVSITEDFVNYVKSIGSDNFSKDEVSEFISIASILILIKSKSIIPELELSENEDRDILIMENQLKTFELLKQNSREVIKLWQKKILLSGKITYKSPTALFVPDPSMKITYFHDYIQGRLEEIAPKKADEKEVTVHKVIKIEDALSHVRQIIKRIKTLNFKNLNDHGDERLREKNKRNLVILFLAVLELVKIGEIDAKQEDGFGDILVEETI